MQIYFMYEGKTISYRKKSIIHRSNGYLPLFERTVYAIHTSVNT